MCLQTSIHNYDQQLANVGLAQTHPIIIIELKISIHMLFCLHSYAVVSWKDAFLPSKE